LCTGRRCFCCFLGEDKRVGFTQFTNCENRVHEESTSAFELNIDKSQKQICSHDHSLPVTFDYRIAVLVYCGGQFTVSLLDIAATVICGRCTLQLKTGIRGNLKAFAPLIRPILE